MAGLNDNFFLADDSQEPKPMPAVAVHAFKDTTEPGEVPELRDDVDLIAVAAEDLHIQLRDLELLQTAIREQGGMNRTIALEAHAIMPDFINDDRPVEFFTKMPSRTLLSAALEDIGNEKKSLIKTMIERIVAFIRKIVKRIKDHFIANEEQAKADAEFAKNYKGAPAQDSSQSAPSGQPSSQQKNDASQDNGVEPSSNTVKEKWTDNKMALITAMLGKDRLAIVAALMEKDLSVPLKQAIVACNSITSTRNKDEAYRHGAELESLTAECSRILAEAASLDEKEQRNKLRKWVQGKDYESISRIVVFYTTNPTIPVAMNKAKDYLEDMENEAEHWKNNSDSDAAAIVKDIQRLISQLASFISVMVKIDNTFSTVIKGLRK